MFAKESVDTFTDVGTKTYTATTDILYNFLDDEIDRRDYPIKATEEEHRIITLPSTEPVIVLGRSGTGKTTVCLNRLWLSFRKHKTSMATETVVSSKAKLNNQVFITKNHTLCDKMKKRFYDFVAGCPQTLEWLPDENQDLPEKLTEVKHFPLFVTAKQFFTMLDKSLGEEEERFFKPGVKVESSTNQADTHSLNLLFELPHDDSDDEEDYPHDNPVQRERLKKKTPPMKEITADEFVTEIWPQIAKYCSEPKIDPLLVWTEIESFIEGSRQSLDTDSGFLLKSDYCKIGQKQAPKGLTREQVYELFEQYKKIWHKDISKAKFSNSDFIWHLNNRIKDVANVPWLIHEIYIDEVQDFTQAEISVILKCCQDPNRSFFAGDTAQTIMKGISFRFEDLRSLFYSLNETDTKHKVPPVCKLTKNYRSHSSITDMASSVIELLQKYFPDAYDQLLPDESNIKGPKPLFIRFKSLLDNFLLKQALGDDNSIEFGADQVIIARDSSERARQNMPKYLQNEIILNIQECKGLEFNDVLLYNFFTDTPKQIQEMWRISAKYLEDHPNKIVSKEPNYVHPLEFNERYHRSFCAELKILYTIVTRARCHIWIYEDTQIEHLPMIKYWQMRNLITIVSQEEIELLKYTQLEKSSTASWKQQGDIYMEKRLWYAAKRCYKKAKEYSLENIAHARALEQKALRTKQTDIEQFRYVAAMFIKCSLLEPKKEHIKNAAICLFRAKMYEEALKLFEMVDEHKYAIYICKTHKKVDKNTLIRLYEKSGKHKLAIKLLLQKQQYDPAVDLALKHPQCYDLVKDLLYKRIKTAIGSKQKRDIVKLVRVVPKLSEQVHYLKEAKMYGEACELLQEKKEYKSLFRICRAQHLYTKGIEIAEKAGPEHVHTMHSFILQQAEYHMITKPTDFVNEKNELEKFLNMKGLKDYHVARACLLLSHIHVTLMSRNQLKGALDLCIKAHSIYQNIQHRVGEIEAVHMLNQIREKRSEYTLEHSKLIVDTIIILNQLCDLLGKPAAAFTNDITKLENFYGLEKYGSNYYYASTQANLFFQMQQSKVIDSDGMIQLDKKQTLRRFIPHYQMYVKKFESYLEPFKCSWHKKLIQSFSFHSDLVKTPYYCQKSYRGYPADEITRYLKMHDDILNIHTKHRNFFQINDILEPINRILSPFSQLCLNFKDKNFQYIAQESHFLKKILSEKAFDELKEIISNIHKTLNFDKWLQNWRLICILGEDKMHQLNLLIDEKAINIYVVWEKMCRSYRQNGDVLLVTNNLLTHLVEVIAKQECLHLTLSLENLIHILTIQCSAIFALLSASSKQVQIIIPESFEQMITIFDLFNCFGQQRTHTGLMAACANQDFASDQIVHDCTEILVKIFKLMIHEKYGLLQKVLTQGTEIETIHCLLLILTIIGNITALNLQHSKIQQLMSSACMVFLKYSSQRVIQKIYLDLKAAKNTKDFFAKVVQPLLKILEQCLQLKVMQSSTSFGKNKIIIKPLFQLSRVPNVQFQWEASPELTIDNKMSTESTLSTDISETEIIQHYTKTGVDEIIVEISPSTPVIISDSIQDTEIEDVDVKYSSTTDQKKEENYQFSTTSIIVEDSVQLTEVRKKSSIFIAKEKNEFLVGNNCIVCHKIADEKHFVSPNHMTNEKLYIAYNRALSTYNHTQDDLKKIIDKCRGDDTAENYALEQKVQEAEQLIEANIQRINKMYKESNEWQQNTKKLQDMIDETRSSKSILSLYKRHETIHNGEGFKSHAPEETKIEEEVEEEEEQSIDMELKRVKLTRSVSSKEADKLMPR